MGVVLPFIPRGAAAVEIKNVRKVDAGGAVMPDRDDPREFAMDDDCAPSELNPDPFIAPDHDCG